MADEGTRSITSGNISTSFKVFLRLLKCLFFGLLMSIAIASKYFPARLRIAENEARQIFDVSLEKYVPCFSLLIALSPFNCF